MTGTEMSAEEMADPGLVVFDHRVADRPQEAYRHLLGTCPVGRSDHGIGGVYISDYESAQFAFRHPEIFSSSADALSIGQEQPLIPLQVDPPLHTEYRRLLNPPFTPKRIAELEPDVRAVVTALIDGLIASGGCDFHEDVATPLPSTIFLRLMGLPQSDLAQFLQWRDNVIRPDVPAGDFDAAAALRAETGKDINAYFEGAIEEARQRGPHEAGLLAELVHADFDGRRLTEAELLGICHLMLLGGLDTVTATLDCMIVYLARHPEQRQLLIDDPSLLGAAVEELLRYESPVMMVPRIVAQPVTLKGVDFSPGDLVTVVVGAANADEAEFDRPADVEWGRDLNRHVAFGSGNHLCLGAHLARLELRVTLEEINRRLPNYRIAEGAEIHFSPGIRQADHLPLVWS
jgi:cytochrome P450